MTSRRETDPQGVCLLTAVERDFPENSNGALRSWNASC